MAAQAGSEPRQQKRKVKKPGKYSRALFAEICDRLAAGESLRKICESFPEGPTTSAVLQWVVANKDDCAAQYARAREAQARLMLDEILTISDDSSGDELILEDGRRVQNHEFAARSRLRVDTRKWFMSKVAPKLYGDKLDLRHSGQVDSTVTVKLTGVQMLLEAARREQNTFLEKRPPEATVGAEVTEESTEKDSDDDDDK